MLDHLSYNVRIDLHEEALAELFQQVKDNRDIKIKDISITNFENADWKDFLLQTITLNNPELEEVYRDENRPLTDLELSSMLDFKRSLRGYFLRKLNEHELLPW